LTISIPSVPSASPFIGDNTVEQINKALKAWIMFGGYGSRTRRGLGSTTVFEEHGHQEDHERWLLGVPTRPSIQRLFGSDLFAGVATTETPSLAGASLLVGPRMDDPLLAWQMALKWLRDFRQSAAAGARQAGSDDRPSISNWPEADKIRHLRKPRRTRRWAHDPSRRHNAIPAWPRAGFGLPIGGQFQRRSRVPLRPGERETLFWDALPPAHPSYGEEPGPFSLRWQSGGIVHDRLASPLIVKALPLADGDYVPCALWLARAMPSDARVGLYAEPTKKLDSKSLAPFQGTPLNGLLAPGDRAHFPPLNKPTLRQAFLDWLKQKSGVTEIAP
jgi:CRISPR-associated protein Cmr1